MVNNLVFRWPKPLFFMVKRGLMVAKLVIFYAMAAHLLPMAFLRKSAR